VARYQAFIAQDAVGICEIDATGQFRLVNRKFCELTGYSEQELLQRRFQDITHPEDLPLNLANLERLVREGVPYGYEKRYLRKDGSDVWVYVSVTRIGSQSDGAMPSILATVLDLSERRRAEAEARATDQNYKTLFNSIDAGFCVIEVIFDAEHRPIDYAFVETNAVFEQLTGLSNARGARMRELVPAHEQHWFDVYGRVASSGEPIRFEQEARALKRWYNVYAFRIDAAGTNKVGVLFEDISARKTSEQRRHFLADLADKLAPLRDERAIMRTAVDAVGCFLQVDRCYFVECLESENRIVVSPNYTREGTRSLEGEMSLFDFGGIEWWQHYAVGFAVNDVSTDRLTRHQQSTYAAVGVLAYLTAPFKREGPWTVVLAVTENRPRVWTADEAKLLEDVVARVWPLIERARSEHALMIAHRELEQRVTERTAKLQDTISELETYSYSISHDLRAPLRAMRTYASILATESAASLDVAGQEYLRRIMAAAERMDRLIRDVLVFSRVARAHLPMERVELGSFVAGVIESYPGLSVATAEIEVISPLGAVRANPAALTQCISNLLGNAIKFAHPGTKPRVRIWSEAKEQKRRLFVRDHGIGIPAEAHEKIFSMFYQLDQAKDGTGIGLAVVRKAVERMGGTIGVTSAPGQGSTFWLELENADARMIL
jgi:PAS domain S-box-containing protein